MGSLAKQLSGKSDQIKMYAKGGKAKHDDEAADKKLIAAELKKRNLKKGGKCK